MAVVHEFTSIPKVGAVVTGLVLEDEVFTITFDDDPEKTVCVHLGRSQDDEDGFRKFLEENLTHVRYSDLVESPWQRATDDVNRQIRNQLADMLTSDEIPNTRVIGVEVPVLPDGAPKIDVEQMLHKAVYDLNKDTETCMFEQDGMSVQLRKRTPGELIEKHVKSVKLNAPHPEDLTTLDNLILETWVGGCTVLKFTDGTEALCVECLAAKVENEVDNTHVDILRLVREIAQFIGVEVPPVVFKSVSSRPFWRRLREVPLKEKLAG